MISKHNWVGVGDFFFSWTHWAISRSSQCPTTGITNVVVCDVLSVGCRPGTSNIVFYLVPGRRIIQVPGSRNVKSVCKFCTAVTSRVQRDEGRTTYPSVQHYVPLCTARYLTQQTLLPWFSYCYLFPQAIASA